MPTQTITIELKFDVGREKQRSAAVRQAARIAARTLLASAALIATTRRPMIAVHSKDFFDGEQEINIDFDSNENEEVE